MGLFNFGKKSNAEGAVAAPSTSSINLIKERTELVNKIVLEKNIPTTQKSRVALILDYSGSMDWLYNNGTVQALVERLIPIGMRFDDDGAIDLFIFHNNAYYVGEVTNENFVGYVNNKVMKKYSMGGTSYSPIIDLVVNHYNKPGDPVYAMFIADGDCGDKSQSRNAITKAAEKGIFWQFIGLGNASMKFLEDLDDMPGRTVDNANFFRVADVTKMSDEDLYSKMMDEYPQYLTEAKRLSII